MLFLSRALGRNLQSPFNILKDKLGIYGKICLSSRNTFLLKPGESVDQSCRFCSNISVTGISSKHIPVEGDEPLQHQNIEVLGEENLLPSERQKQQNDLLMLKINASDSADEVLCLYSKHQEVMSGNHYLGTLNRLRVLVEEGVENIKKIHEMEAFQELCHNLWKISRRLEVDKQVSLLKNLCRLEVSTETKIMQSVLQLLRHSINDLELRQMIYLDFLLKKLSKTPLSDGLLVAIPVVIETSLRNEQLEELSMRELSQTLAVCVQGKTRNIGIVLQEIYKRGTINSTTMALSLLWSLVKMFVTDGKKIFISREDSLTREVLMKECLECIAKDLSSLTQQQIETTLEKLREAHGKRDYCTYNEHFLNSVAKHAITKKWDFTAVAHTIRKLHKMNFISEDLLYFMVEQVIQSPEIAINSKIHVLSLLMALGGCELHHPNLHQALNILVEHHAIAVNEENMFKRPWIRIAVELLSLHYHYEQLLELVTDEQFLSVYMSRKAVTFADHIFLLRLHQALITLGHSSLSIPEKYLITARTYVANRSPSKSDLIVRVNQILDTPDHLVSGVIADNDVYIDHLLVINEHGKSVNIKPSDLDVHGNIRISSLDIPENFRRIAIINIGSTYAFGPGCRLKGYVRLEQRVLETSGFQVVHIMQPELYRLPPDERNLHIQRQIASAGVNFS